MSSSLPAIRPLNVKAIHVALGCVCVLFFALLFVHLRADFPNHSPWQDWSKTTDEGWYGGGAIQRTLLGRWCMPGIFNPWVVSPAWSAMLMPWFRLLGTGIVAARVLALLLFGASLGMFYRLLRRETSTSIALAGVALMLVNPFMFFFNRLAILEPAVTFWFMLALTLAASRHRGKPASDLRRDVQHGLALGLALGAMVLTKSNSLVFFPAVAWQLRGYSRRAGHPWLRTGAIAVLTTATVWLGYYLLFVRPYFLPEYRAFFATTPGRPHLVYLSFLFQNTVYDGRWYDPILYPLAIIVAGWVLVRHRSMHSNPLFVSAYQAAGGVFFFIFWHASRQPRYYMVACMPLTMMLLLGLHAIMTDAATQRKARRWAVALAVVIATAGCRMAFQTLTYLAHPDYTELTAANEIAAHMRTDADDTHPAPGPNPAPILGDVANTFTLFNGIPAISYTQPTDGLAAELALYHPRWFCPPVGEQAQIDDVARFYRLEEVAHYTVFDDPTRNLLLYRLHPLTSER